MSRITNDLVELMEIDPARRTGRDVAYNESYMKRAVLLIVWIYLGLWVAGIILGIADTLLSFLAGKIPLISRLESCSPVLCFIMPILAFVLGTKGILPGPAGCTPKAPTFFVYRALVASIAIHVLFIVQAYLSLPLGGMVSNGFYLMLFYPHYLLDYCLPPAYPIDYVDGVMKVNYLGFWGKMLVAFPASLAYGVFLAGVTVNYKRNVRKEIPK
jgi:hypothetical protein